MPSEHKEEARTAVVEALRRGRWASASCERARQRRRDALVRGGRPCGGRRRRAARPVIVSQGREPPRPRLGRDVARRGCPRGPTRAPNRPPGTDRVCQGAARRQEIAEASPRLEALILGPADMSVSLGFASPAEGPRWDYVRGALLVAARAAGIQAIDGPYLQIADTEGLRCRGPARARARLRRKVGASPRPGRAAQRALHPDLGGGRAGRAILAALDGRERRRGDARRRDDRRGEPQARGAGARPSSARLDD